MFLNDFDYFFGDALSFTATPNQQFLFLRFIIYGFRPFGELSFPHIFRHVFAGIIILRGIRTKSNSMCNLTTTRMSMKNFRNGTFLIVQHCTCEFVKSKLKLQTFISRRPSLSPSECFYRSTSIVESANLLSGLANFT